MEEEEGKEVVAVVVVVVVEVAVCCVVSSRTYDAHGDAFDEMGDAGTASTMRRRRTGLAIVVSRWCEAVLFGCSCEAFG